MTELRMALDACERRAKEASSSFVASFASLPASKRAAVNAVYAYCRWVDDIVDGDADERLPVTDEVMVKARTLLDEHPELMARDGVHAAVVLENELDGICSWDRDFDVVTGLTRVEP